MEDPDYVAPENVTTNLDYGGPPALPDDGDGWAGSVDVNWDGVEADLRGSPSRFDNSL